MEKAGGGSKQIQRSVEYVWEPWKWDQYLSKNMKWQFGKMGSMSMKKPWKDFWIFETFIFHLRASPHPSTYRFPLLHQPPLVLRERNSWSQSRNLVESFQRNIHESRITNPLMNEFSMVSGSWLKAHAQGSSLMAKGGGPCPKARAPSSLGTAYPWAGLAQLAMTHEPWTVKHNKSTNEKKQLVLDGMLVNYFI